MDVETPRPYTDQRTRENDLPRVARRDVSPWTSQLIIYGGEKSGCANHPRHSCTLVAIALSCCWRRSSLNHISLSWCISVQVCKEGSGLPPPFFLFLH